jgi:flagellar assembly factor FliW
LRFGEPAFCWLETELLTAFYLVFDPSSLFATGGTPVAEHACGMKCLTLTDPEAAPAAAASELRLPMGLLGFEHLKNYLLVANPGEEPFLWLQVKDKSTLSFVVVNPFLVKPDYRPDLPQSDVDFLEVQESDDVVLFNIVTLHPSGAATVNLKGPIALNRHTLVGKQVVLANAAEYNVEHPLPVSDVTS